MVFVRWKPQRLPSLVRVWKAQDEGGGAGPQQRCGTCWPTPDDFEKLPVVSQTKAPSDFSRALKGGEIRPGM